MSTLSLAPRPGLLGIPTDRATSEPGVRLSRDVEGALAAAKVEPLANSRGYQVSLAELENLAAECSRPGWDGYDAEPLHPGALELARRLILALPKGYDSPSVAAHPDGEVALTWQGARGTDFSVSVGASGQLSYAGVFGPSVVSYGSDNFTDDLPATVLDHLRRLP